MVAQFQKSVPIQYGFGIPGALYDDSPSRAAPWELNSASAAYNIIGSTAYTATSADPGSAIASGVAAAGGTGQFVGILSNAKVYSTSGPSTGALDPTLALPNLCIAELISMGHLIVSLPGPASIGDAVSYDTTTGKLSSYVRNVSFTASIASGGVMTVTGVPVGTIQPGMIVSGVGAAGIVIESYGTGTGGAGTYNTNYEGAGAVSSTTFTGLALPPPAFSATASSISTAGAMVISAVASGDLAIGAPVYGTGIPANSVITAQNSGTSGGTGTYTISPAPAATLGSTAVTGDAMATIARAEVILFNPAGNGGLGVVSLTSA